MSSIILQGGLCIHSRSGIAQDYGSAFWGHRIDVHAASDLKASELNRFRRKVHVPVVVTVLKAIAGHAVDVEIVVWVVKDLAYLLRTCLMILARDLTSPTSMLTNEGACFLGAIRTSNGNRDAYGQRTEKCSRSMTILNPRSPSVLTSSSYAQEPPPSVRYSLQSCSSCSISSGTKGMAMIWECE